MDATRKTVIVTDSSCDLSDEQLSRYGIRMISLRIVCQNAEYRDRIDIQEDELYELLTHELPKTSLPLPEDVSALYESLAQEGVTDVIHISISSGLSGTFNMVRMITQDFESRMRVHMVDSRTLSMGLGMMVLAAARALEEGATPEEAIERAQTVRRNQLGMFVIRTLEFLRKGGRIGKVTGRAANILGIKPMILFKEGEIFSAGVARGRQKSFEKALDLLMTYLAEHNGTPDDYCITVGYGYDADEGKRLWMQTRAALRAKYPTCECNVVLLQIGCTIAVHTGPYALGMGVMRRWKKA